MPVAFTPGLPIWYELPRADNGSILQGEAMQEQADAILPKLDGETVVLGDRPEDFFSDDPPTFRLWHTAHQLEYILSRQPADNLAASLGDGATVSSQTLSIPPDADPADQIHAIVRADGSGIIILNDLTPSALNRLSLPDQALVAAHPQFGALISEPFGLRPTTGETSEAVRAELIADIDAIIAAIDGAPPLLASSGIEDPASLIVAQLEAMKVRLGTMAIFDETAIDTTLADVLTRFERLSLYSAAAQAAPDAAISTDGNASLRSAYDIFVQSEQRRLDIVRATDGIAETGLLAVQATDGSVIAKSMDVPLLLFAFQRAENADGEAEGQSETEEIRQRNTLLQDYASMQELVNKVSASFPTPDGEANKVTDTRQVSAVLSGEELAEALATLRMFDTALAGIHPAEALSDLTRPTLALDVDGATVGGAFTKDQYDSFASNLGNAVEVLNRDVQVLSDKANQISRERNRHFELATQTLSRMTDLIQAISAGIN